MEVWGWPQWVMLFVVLWGTAVDAHKLYRDATKMKDSLTVPLTRPLTAWVLWMGGFWA